ncbi:MAG TPA: ABC transporter permease [Terriglobia bacterium]|nr:ABC transporter permease [Terriglobia bacterium]
MSLFRNFAAGIRTLFRKQNTEREMDEELRGYLQTAVAERMRSGMSRESALRAARMEMGSFEAVKENIRNAGWESTVESVWQDLRYGLRMLWRAPGFSALAVSTLGLGIGATTMIFSALNATLWRPFPFPDPGRLVMVWGTGPETGGWGHASVPDYLDWKSHPSVFTSVAAYGEAEPADVVAWDQHFRTRVLTASANLLATLGVRPSLGMLPAANQDNATDRDAIISFNLWQDRFGGSSGITGKEIKVNQQAYRIVGVLPADFLLPLVEGQHYEVVAPLAFMGAGFTNRAARELHLLGRLGPRVTFAQAQAEATRSAGELARTYPQFHHSDGARVADLSQSPDSLQSPLWILFGAVLFLLLVACGNVASLLLARGLVRQREFSVRAALGASRPRVVRQLLAESFLLAGAGGLVGFVLANWGTRALAALGSATIPQLARVTIDAHAAAFAALITISAVFIFGLVPALEVSRVDVQQSLREAGVSMTAGARHVRLRSLLVTVQVALAVTVLCGAGLLLRSFYDLILTNPGLRVENLALADLSKAGGPAAQIAFYEGLLGHIRLVPGVQFAALTSSIPLGSEALAPMPAVTVPGDSLANPPDAMTRVVTPSYFASMGIPMLEGRDFNEADSPAGERVAIVNRVAVRRLFPNGHALGRELEILPSTMNTGFPVRPGTVRIVGVIGDVMHWFTGTDPHLDTEIYLPYAQSPVSDVTLVVRSATALPPLARQLTAQITAADPAALLGSVTTMQRELSDAVAPRRFYPALVTAFASVALVLAAAGIYGVLSHLVRQRSHEIGIRLVLGARPVDVVRIVLSQGLRPAFVGAALGIAGALGLTRFLAGLLYGVRPMDPATYVMTAVLLAGVAFIASYIPARRAGRVDPMAALRYE